MVIKQSSWEIYCNWSYGDEAIIFKFLTTYLLSKVIIMMWFYWNAVNFIRSDLRVLIFRNSDYFSRRIDASA